MAALFKILFYRSSFSICLILSMINSIAADSQMDHGHNLPSLLRREDIPSWWSPASSPPVSDHVNCTEEIWCLTTDQDFYDEDEYYDDPEEGKGFWLERPPDDIAYMPPPPIPPSFTAFLQQLQENHSLENYAIHHPNNNRGRDPDMPELYRCNFCTIFAGSNYVGPDPDPEVVINSEPSKDLNQLVSSFYLILFGAIALVVVALVVLIKYKKWRIFPVSESCPILTVLGVHKAGSSGSGGSSPSDNTRLPVVNEKSPQSIILDAPLASLGKKSTISTTGKYWKRIPNGPGGGGPGGNIFSMEDRRALRSLGGSSTGMSSDHPYSDAASCTSSPVYAELDPSVAGSCRHTPTLIGPPGTGSIVSGFSPYAFSNTYSEVPENLHHGHRGGGGHHHGISPSLMTDSSTYDNAAYLPAHAQQQQQQATPFMHSTYSTRSLRRLAAQRSAALSGGALGGTGGSQVSTPLLAGHPYQQQQQPSYHHQSVGTMQHHHGHGHHQLQSTPIQPQFHFLTGGRPLKKPRPGQQQLQPQYHQQTSFGSYGGIPAQHHFRNRNAMNHYVTQDHEPMILSGGNGGGHEDSQQQLITSPGGGGNFSSFLDNTSNGSGSNNRKSSSSSQTYTEMPLLAHHQNLSGPSVSNYRMTETNSAHDLNSASSSSSSSNGGGGGSGNQSSNSSASLKRPLPPVPTNTAGHVRL